MLDRKPSGQVFILGKNWKLSLAELLSFMETRGGNFKMTHLTASFIVADAEELQGPEIIKELGGILKIGQVVAVMPTESLENAFIKRRKEAQAEIRSLLSSSNATDATFKHVRGTMFGVSIYVEGPRFLRSSRIMQRFIGSYFKKQLILGGTKAKFMGTPRSREPPQLTNVEVLKKSLIEKSAEILFCIGRDEAFLCTTTAVHNPFEFQKRDVQRPVQRRIFSIPPRVARIMVNLASCLPGTILLDPFCGVGTILQEAMLAGANVIGIDKNPWCVDASTENLEWLHREYNLTVKSRIIVGDARNLTKELGRDSINCIATEPALGPALRNIPTESYAKRIIMDLDSLYESFLGQAYDVLKSGGKVVFVAPYIRTRRGVFQSLDIREKATRIGFKTVPPFAEISEEDTCVLARKLAGVSSLVDIEERHKIGREIHILQK